MALPFRLSRNNKLIEYYYDRSIIDLTPFNISGIACGAFDNCPDLNTIILPEGLRSIENDAFRKCKSLTNIVFPSTLETITGNPFVKTKWYKNQMKNGFVEANGILIDINSKLLKSSSIERLNTIKQINRNAFEGIKDMKLVDLSSMTSLEHIDAYSFYENPSIEQVVFPKECKLKTIREFAFARCTRLQEVILPDNVDDIYGTAFMGTPYGKTLVDRSNKWIIYKDKLLGCSEQCDELKELNMEKEEIFIHTICSRAFEWASFQKISLSKNVQKIMHGSFDSCMNLKSVIFPDDIKYIGKYAFANCSNLPLEQLSLPENSRVESTAFDAVNFHD